MQTVETTTSNPNSTNAVLADVGDNVTYEEMYEWLEKFELQEPRIVRALMKEIGYPTDAEVLHDDNCTKTDDYYIR